jgi:hypothetical protein
LRAIKNRVKKNMGPSKLSYCMVRPSIVAAAKEITRNPGNYRVRVFFMLTKLEREGQKRSVKVK